MDFSQPPISEILDAIRLNGIRIVAILLIALIALRAGTLVFHGVVRTLLDREASEGTAQDLSAVEVQKRVDTLDQLGGRVIRFFVVVIAGIMVLGAFGLDIGPAIAGLGVVGIAVGFGAQSLVRDYLNGALVLIENQYSKGDVVTIAGVSGAVEDFSLRRTTLRDLDGVVHTVPNGEIKVASNLTRNWARINENVTVAFGTDIDRAIEVVDDVGRRLAEDPVWKRRILEPPRVERVDQIGELGITLKILGSVRASEQWATGGAFRKLLLAAFVENGIEIPRPHRVVFTQRQGGEAGSGEPGTGGPLSPGPTQDDLAGDD